MTVRSLKAGFTLVSLCLGFVGTVATAEASDLDALIRRVELRGGHHFDRDYGAISRAILQAAA